MYKVKEVSSMLVCAEEQKNDQPNADQELQQPPCAVTQRVTPVQPLLVSPFLLEQNLL